LFDRLLERVRKQALHLRFSLQRAKAAATLPEAERLERYEALTARFSRLQDMLVAPYKTVAHLELEPDKAERVIDLLNFMEKLGLLSAAAEWAEIRRLRNVIAHEYWDDPAKAQDLLREVERHSATLLDAVERLEVYSRRIAAE
jgi:uncharacterized protein YutE (UPF0331/DUF86 family)